MKKYNYDVLVMEDELTKHIHENLFLLESYMIDHHYQWQRRCDIETHSKYRQMIPYITIRKEGKFALFLRVNGGEKRLKGKYTIGLGGHIERKDALNRNLSIIGNGMTRELNEEIVVSDEFCKNIEFLSVSGTIRLDSTIVDSVHFGIWYDIILGKKFSDIKINDDELEFVGWYNKEKVLKFDIEKWSFDILSKA